MTMAPRPAIRQGTFGIGERDFLLNGEPFRILSGALHYFRVHPDQWADRIKKARQMGLNTIETYVPWNAHSPSEGTFISHGDLDLGRFLDLVAAEGMYAIVRPGPYICAEWSNGGLPAWLLRDESVRIRRNEPGFMAAVDAYYRELEPILAPRQIDLGGPIILVQVENEYGAYGNDKEYLRKLVELTRSIGITVPLTTVDQPMDDMLERGGLPELHKTGSFGSRAIERLATLRRHQPTGPLMCSEFWDGWFDDWGAPHHVTSVVQTAAELTDLLAGGASVNIYMFHGGTNFGFSNGANDKGTYLPITTSYDYDAPLDEAGNPTAKYWAFRDVLARYGALDDDDDRPAPAQPAPELSVRLDRSIPLWDVVDRLGDWRATDELTTADALGQSHGFTLYRAAVETRGASTFEVDEVRDRALVFLDRVGIGTISRERHERSIRLPRDAHGSLELLVEDQGRVDYGTRIGEPKGLIGEARLRGVPVRGWRALPLPLTDISAVAEALATRSPSSVSGVSGSDFTGPVFAAASFAAPASADLFLDTSGWGKGVVWINGFCLGRYWSRGPQHTLYVPAPVLRPGGNELILFELEDVVVPVVSFVAAPKLGPTS